MRHLALFAVCLALSGCGDPVKPEPHKPIIAVCSGCGSVFESYGPGESEPITECPNCPITREVLDALIGRGR
jgi:uncharacterized protein YceK